jgi:hypothetical protein
MARRSILSAVGDEQQTSSEPQRKRRLRHHSRSCASPQPRASPAVMQSCTWVEISTRAILSSLRFKAQSRPKAIPQEMLMKALRDFVASKSGTRILLTLIRGVKILIRRGCRST